MKRISREELRMLIQIGLTVRKKYERRHLELQMTSAVEAVTDAIVMRIMGSVDSETVLLTPDMVGPSHSPWHGKWDIDEPHPHPDIPFRNDIGPRRSVD
jgi:hypothetical protein